MKYERYKENETEDLLTKAIQLYKPSHEEVKPRKKKVKTSENTEENVNEAKIGRFQIMGIVQAARYYVLYGDMDKAKSLGQFSMPGQNIMVKDMRLNILKLQYLLSLEKIEC